jgi:division protein CdvB (Snf7/Vps24/ESCRT-III family)
MGSTVQSMSTAMKGMEVDQIAKTMSEFERQFENMDVTSGTSATRKRCDSYPRSVLSLSN